MKRILFIMLVGAFLCCSNISFAQSSQKSYKTEDYTKKTAANSKPKTNYYNSTHKRSKAREEKIPKPKHYGYGSSSGHKKKEKGLSRDTKLGKNIKKTSHPK